MKGILSFGSANHKRLLPHRNRGLEIVYVSKGYLRWHVNGQPETLYPESVFFTLPWQVHGSVEEHARGNLIHWTLMKLGRDYDDPLESVTFRSELGLSKKDAEEIGRSLCSASRHTWPASEKLAWLVPAAVEEMQRAGEMSSSCAWALLRAVLIELHRTISEAAPIEGSPVHISWQVERFIRELPEISGRDWTLDSMALHCHLRRTQFATLISKLTGESPMTYLNRVRVNRARQLLVDPSLNITDIAFDCGFNSSQYFSKVFRRFCELSPSEFRERGESEYASLDLATIGWRTETEERTRMLHRDRLSWQ